MSSEDLTDKYIASMEKTMKTIQRVPGAITVNEMCLNELVGYVNAYLADAKYFRAQRRFETSLTSIAYCEGLLDALKLIGAVKTASGP